MGSSGRGPLSAGRRCALLLLIPALGCAAPLVGKGTKGTCGESWTASVDNDSYNFDDGNYTNGVDLVWTSAPVARHPQESLPRRIAGTLSSLPSLGGSGLDRFVSIGYSHLVFTPERINVRNPARGERPYAGVFVVDGAVLARSDEWLTGVLLRLGLVGEGSLAEEFQKEIHPWFGAESPDGWDTQLADEPVLNLSWVHRRRAADGRLGPLEWDVTPAVTLHAGTFLTGASGEVRVRFGPDLPLGLEPVPPRVGFEAAPLVGTPSGSGSAWYGFWEAGAHGVAHYLPIDGGVFRGGRSANGEPLVGSSALGVAIGRGPLVLTLAYTLLTDAYEAQGNPGQFGTISLAWHR